MITVLLLILWKNIQYFSILLILEACFKALFAVVHFISRLKRIEMQLIYSSTPKPLQPNRMISRMTISFWIIFVLLSLKYTCPVQICELYFSSLLWSYSKNSESKFFLNFYFFVTELSKYIPEGRLDPMTFQNMMEAANMNYYLAKVNFCNLLKWFHVKYELQKNSVISTLWTRITFKIQMSL